MIIVSACLAGNKCRYDGNSNLVPEIQEMVLEGKALALCPEELGDLPTPRIACEIQNNTEQTKVISLEGTEYTEAFQLGANKVTSIAEILDCKTAILKSRSPSCGYGQIYDGSFSGKIVSGKGICAVALEQKGIRIFNEDNYYLMKEDDTKKFIP